MITLLLQDAFSGDHAEDDDSDNDDNCPSESFSSASVEHCQPSPNVDKDLILVKISAIFSIIPIGESRLYLIILSLCHHQVHLLHLACGSKGPLADALPQISSELYNLGVSNKAAAFQHRTSFYDYYTDIFLFPSASF